MSLNRISKILITNPNNILIYNRNNESINNNSQ